MIFLTEHTRLGLDSILGYDTWCCWGDLQKGRGGAAASSIRRATSIGKCFIGNEG